MKTNFFCIMISLATTGFVSVHAMQGVSRLIRSYSTCPALNDLKKAIESDNSILVAQHLISLPQALDIQYELFGHTQNKGILRLLLEVVRNHWLRRINTDAIDGLACLRGGYIRLKIDYVRYQLFLDQSFELMVRELEAYALSFENVQTQQINGSLGPGLLPLNVDLKHLTAYAVALKLSKDSISHLPADLADLIAETQPKIIAQPALARPEAA